MSNETSDEDENDEEEERGEGDGKENEEPPAKKIATSEDPVSK